MALSPDGRRVLTTCIDRVVRLWDVDRTKPIALLDAAGGDSGALEMPMFSSVAFSPDGRRAVAAIPEDRAVHVWQLPAASVGSASDTIRITSSIALDIAPVGGQLWSAIYSPDGADLLTVGGNEARLFDAETGQEMISFSPHGAVASANFSPDGRRVVTGSWDRSAKIWSTETGRSILKLAGGHTGPVNGAVFSTDAAGSQVLTASDDGTAMLWDATTGELLVAFEGHEGRVRSASFSPDGRLVLTASDDATARVWDSQTGEELFVLAGHRAAVVCATFSRDGRWAITGSDDKTAKIWDLETQSEIQLPKPLQWFLRRPTRRKGHLSIVIVSLVFSPFLLH